MKNARLTGSYRVGLQTMKGYTGIESALSELPTSEDGAVYGWAFYAVDTGDTYLFNENTNSYVKVTSSGGGSSATVGEGVLTIAQGETTLGTFSANATEDATIYIETTDSVSESSTDLVTSSAVYNAIGRGTTTLMVGDETVGTIDANEYGFNTITIPTTTVQQGATSLVTAGAVYDAIQTAITEVENGTY